MYVRNTLAVQWLGLHAFTIEGLGSAPGLGRSPLEGNGYQLQYSYLEIPMTEEPGGL